MASADKSSIVLGIDIGSDKCVVAFVDKKGVVDALQNEASERETPVVVHFDKRQRLFGSAGAARANMDPKATISQLKRLIGRRFDEMSFQKERTLLPYETSSGPDGEVMVSVQYCDTAWQFTAVEMLGMFLCHLKRMADKATESTISECVIGIPSYFTDQQRRDYLLAAAISGLKPLRLFHDGAATALDYGLHRNLPHGEATNVVFVDIGHGDTQVTVVRFCFGTATVLAHSFDRDLGGRDFDDVIFKSFAEKFERDHCLNVLESPKATLRLRTACEKAKKVLSSNSEAHINIECLVGDNDLAGGITRTEFENLSSGLLERIIAACKRALADTDLIKKEIHSVELVGSGTRIPKISEVLKDFFGLEMSRTLNGSECIANGCALQCAMLNGAPGAGIFGVHDRMPFSVFGSSACMSSSTSTSMIDKGNFLLSPRMLTLCPSKFVTISYANLNDLPDGVLPEIMRYEVACENAMEKYSLEIRVQFSIHGIIDVKSASLQLITKALALPEPLSSSEKVSQNCNSPAGENSKAPELEHSPEIQVEGVNFDANASTSRCFSAPQLDVKISEVPSGTETQKALEKAKALELTLIKQDKAIERAKNRRNDLEAYMYQARDQLSRGVGQLASKSRQDCVTNMLNSTGAWLDETGTEEPETLYTEKLSELQLAIRELREDHMNIIIENEKKEIFITNINQKMDVLASKFKEYLRDADKGKLQAMRHDIMSFVKRDGIIPEEEYRQQTGKVDWLLYQIEGRCNEELSRSRQTGPFGWIQNNLFGRSPMPADPTILPGATSVATTGLSRGNQRLTGNGCQTMDGTLSPSAPEQISYTDEDMPDVTDDAITPGTNVMVGNADKNSQEISSAKCGQQSDHGGHKCNGEKKTEKTRQGEGFYVVPSGRAKSQEAPNIPRGGMQTKPKQQSSSKTEDELTNQHQGYTHLDSRMVGNSDKNSKGISSAKHGLQNDHGGHNSNGEKKTEKIRQGESYNVVPGGRGKSHEAPNHPHGGRQTKPKHQSSSKMEDKLTNQHQGYTHLDSRVNPTKNVSMIREGDYIVIRGRPCVVEFVSANEAGNKHGRIVQGTDILTQEFFEENVPIKHFYDIVCFTDCLLDHMSDNGDAIFRADSGILLDPLKLPIPMIAEIEAKREEGLVLQALIMSWLTEMKICEWKFVPRR